MKRSLIFMSILSTAIVNGSVWASPVINTEGISGGEFFRNIGVWVEGLYNHSKQNTTASNVGFKANTRGVAIGIDNKISKAMTVGLGYSYTNTSVDAKYRAIDIDGHNVFLYGQYQPNNWYANWLMSYGYSKYDEKALAKAKYHVNSYAASMRNGYQFDMGIALEWGLHYTLADQESYVVAGNRVHSDKSDLLTGSVGIRYAKMFRSEKIQWSPHINGGITYDFASDNSKTNVEIVHGNNYQINGKRLHRFGVEAGAGVAMSVGAWDLSADYHGGYRKDFQSHTGMLKAKYNF